MVYRTRLIIFSLGTASIVLSLIGFISPAQPVHANSIGDGVNDIAGTIGLKDDTQGVEGAKGKTITIVQTAISYLGIIMLILVIYGGFLWMTAAGSEDRVKKAKEIITAAVIGVLIVVCAYAIVSVVFKVVFEDTQRGAGGYREREGGKCGPDAFGIECEAWLICRNVLGTYRCTTR